MLTVVHNEVVNLLESIIDGATEDAVSTSNLLRKIVVVSHRIQSTETLAWAESEIAGYDPESLDKLPEYRGPLKVAVRGTYSGPMGSSATQVLSDYGVPEDYVSALFDVRFFQPLAELEEMARNRDANLGVPWSAALVTKWNEWEEAERVPYIPMMGLFAARRVVTPAMIGGVIDTIRSAALKFALDLQAANPMAGETGGPTVRDSDVREAVNSVFHTYIYGSGTNVAFGDGNVQSISIAQGDLVGLLSTVEHLGLDKNAVQELASIVTGSVSAEEKLSRVQRFTERIREGAIAITGSVTVKVVADQVQALVRQFLG